MSMGMKSVEKKGKAAGGAHRVACFTLCQIVMGRLRG